MVVSASLIPFHLQAEDEGTYVLEGRAREGDAARRVRRAEEPSENAD